MVEYIPVPPPWREISSSSGILYINEITREETDIHPLTEISAMFNHFPEENEIVKELHQGDISEIKPPTDYNFIEFRSNWLTNGIQYGLSLRLYLNDEHIEIRFDGVDGEWVYSYLEGPYGPVTRHDLFIGAHLYLFGRKITITSCTCQAGDWIFKTASEMRKRITWLQSKIENVGAIPVVRRKPPVVVRDVVRDPNPGRDDLRRLQREIARLGEQLADLGMSHLLDPTTPRSGPETSRSSPANPGAVDGIEDEEDQWT